MASPHASRGTASPRVARAGEGGGGRRQRDGGWSGQKMLSGKALSLKSNKIEGEVKGESWARLQSHLTEKARLPGAWT